MTALTLWVPMPPDNANSRGHWSALYRAQKAYLLQLGVRRLTNLIAPPPPAAPFPRARIDVLRVLEGRDKPIDTDNFVRRCKPLVDWLVRAGYLSGDDPARLAWGAVEQVRGPVPDGRPPLASLRVTLTPLPVTPAAP